MLNLLARDGVIDLAPGKGLTPTLLDITANPKKIEIVELDAAQLPRAVPDLDAAAINGNYAHDAGFDPTKDAIAIESRTNNPYGNFVAAPGGRQGCAADPQTGGGLPVRRGEGFSWPSGSRARSCPPGKLAGD